MSSDNELSNDHYIIIDCKPFQSRPDTILNNILVDTNLLFSDFTNTSTSFGAWTFKLNKNKIDDFVLVSNSIYSKLLEQYKSGRIRHAEICPIYNSLHLKSIIY